MKLEELIKELEKYGYVCVAKKEYEQLKEDKEKAERLQEQLNEANKLIKDFHEMHEFNKSVIEYLEKWCVK